MWEQVGMLARAANADGVPAITDPWPVKDVSWQAFGGGLRGDD